MLNDCIDFKEAVFSAGVPGAGSSIYWCVKPAGFTNPVVGRGRERYRESKRAWGYFPDLLIKCPIITCGAMALPP